MSDVRSRRHCTSVVKFLLFSIRCGGDLETGCPSGDFMETLWRLRIAGVLLGLQGMECDDS